MKTILHTVDVTGSPDRLYQAVLTAEGLAGWWSTNVKSARPSVGEVVDFTFTGDFNPDMRIEALEPDRLVIWRCIGGHEPWHDNTFRFELVPLGEDRTRLRFRQEYATELDDDVYGTYNFNWGYYLQSFKDLVETGTGKPFDPGVAQ